MTIHSVGISQLGNFDYALTVAVGDGQPTISVDLIPGTFDGDGNLVTPHLVESGEAGSSILSLVVQADAPIPEGGLVVNINTDLADITQFIQGSNFIPTTFGGQVLGAVYGDDGKATGIQVRLDNTNMVVNFSTGLGLDAAGPQSVRFFVEPGEGYQPSSEQATVTVYDSLDQVPVATSLPEVSLSFVGSTIFEGLGTATLNFAVEGEIPAEGIVVYVDRGFFGALNDFDLFNARVQGGAFPAPDGQAGGFYFKITEPIASITLEVLVDELQEGIEAATFTLQPGAGYSVAADASRSTLLIADGPNAEIQVSYAASPEVLIETENTASVHTLSLSAPPPAGGLTVTVQAPSLGEFDTAGLVLSSGVTVTDVRLGEFDILLTEQTATLSYPSPMTEWLKVLKRLPLPWWRAMAIRLQPAEMWAASQL
ncbi:MAG: hypothetical protein HC857_04205 [Synechococcales cyanobacterium RU_4_20]|nr:hypothetical protein [Synechococcales cyanobacterium RU_4_20]